MAIEIREYLGAKFTHFTERSLNHSSRNFTEATNYSNRVAPNSLMAEIEGLHTVVTRNDTLYTDAAQKKAARLWTQPYERPVIMHHNEVEGITIGRIKEAYWTDHETRSGTGATRFIVNIGHKDGIDGINNGTLSTVSVGLIANEVRCSICNQDLASEGECEHERGAYYDGKKCVWIIHDFEPKELSFVIVPSDPFAHILKVEEVKESTKNKNLKENLTNKEVNNMHGTWDSLIAEGEKILAESASKKTKEDEDKKEEAKKKAEGEKDDDNNNVQDKGEATEGDNESNKQEDEVETKEEDNEEKSSADEQGQGDTEPAVEDEKSEEKNEENSEEEKTEKAEDNKDEEGEEKPKTPKALDEDHQKDIDNKKDDIYKGIESDLAAEKEANQKLQSELEALKKELNKLKTSLATEKQLKEAAESQLMVFKTEKKKNLVEQVNKLRTELKLEPECVKTLMEANEDALHFSIKNLKEFSKMSKGISTIESPVAVSEEKDNTIKNISDVKESAKDSNIDFEGPDALVKIFSEAMTGQNGFGF